MKYKLLCSDLDDTLISRKGRVCKTTKHSIKKYEQAGGKFCIVTGRMPVGAMRVVKELDLHGELICYQGAIMIDIDSGEILYSSSIPFEDALEIGLYIESLGYYYQTYVGDKFYTATPEYFTEVYKKLSNADYVATGGKLSDFIRENRISPPKILIMNDPAVIQKTLADLQEKFGDKYLINTSKPFIIEIVPHGVSKGIAVRRLAEKYGIKQEEIICVGDSSNDLTMIEYAGLGICVENGADIAKEKSDIIAPPCDNDAISWVINEICFKD